MVKKLSLIVLLYSLCTIFCTAQQNPKTRKQIEVSIPDTILIRTDKGNMIISCFYVISGKNIMRVSHNQKTEKRDTVFYEGMDEDSEGRYRREVYLLKLKSKPIEQINDREAFDYFSIGDSIQAFTSRLGNKKVHVSYTGYQLIFPDELTKKPQVIEFVFWDGILKKIERITKVNSLPTNDVWTAFQLMQVKESLNDLEKAINLLRAKSKKH